MNQNKEFEEIISRMVSDFPSDKVEWNKYVAPYLREMEAVFHKALTKQLEEVKKNLEIETRAFELRKDNPQYSLGQTNGWYLAKEEIDKKLNNLNP